MSFGRPQIIWTDELVEALREAIAGGMSLGRAAEYLSAKFDLPITKNAAVGKASRSGIKSMIPPSVTLQRSPEKRDAGNPKKMLSRLPPIVRAVKLATPIEEPKSLQITVLNAKRHHCRWTDDNGNPYRFCGATVSMDDIARNRSFCEFHSRIVYVPVKYGVNVRPSIQATSTRGWISE